MAWENIDERLKKVLKVNISFPHGSVWLPDTRINIHEWLTSIAETDEELKELDIRRIEFLRNRWPLEKLVELRWDEASARRAVWAMNVGNTAYILFSDGLDYQLIAAIEPRTTAALYQAVINKLLQNSAFFAARPTRIRNYRPDLISNIETETESETETGYAASESTAVPSRRPQSGKKQEDSYLSKLIVGWVGHWIDLPVLGYWHHDAPESITASNEGKYVVTFSDRKAA